MLLESENERWRRIKANEWTYCQTPTQLQVVEWERLTKREIGVGAIAGGDWWRTPGDEFSITDTMSYWLIGWSLLATTQASQLTHPSLIKHSLVNKKILTESNGRGKPTTAYLQLGTQYNQPLKHKCLSFFKSLSNFNFNFNGSLSQLPTTTRLCLWTWR